jgi:hypothetical protein
MRASADLRSRNDPFGHLLEDPANALTGVLQPQHFDPVGFAEMDPILQSL